MTVFGIVVTKECTIYESYGTYDGKNLTGISDDMFSGWAVVYDTDSLRDGWIRITTHYGYSGYVWKENIKDISAKELEHRQNDEAIHRIIPDYVDVLDEAKVYGNPISHLLKNSFVRVLEYCDDGWCIIETAGGLKGYVHTVFLEERVDDDGFLFGVPIDRQSGLQYLENEDSFRRSVTDSARAYLGTQYRWGGKSSLGIDCSGLAFISYFENGLLIYRDAKIVPGYPVHEISGDELKEGDLIFFPGHVALYLGNNRYIHSTAYRENACVTINSFNPADSDYRPDLPDKITAYGSVF